LEQVEHQRVGQDLPKPGGRVLAERVEDETGGDLRQKLMRSLQDLKSIQT
jgi:hypothetical protein